VDKFGEGKVGKGKDKRREKGWNMERQRQEKVQVMREGSEIEKCELEDPSLILTFHADPAMHLSCAMVRCLQV